ncbi:hypothetical protein GCM10010383_69840 [Streptomyces lomondensis]|uniref:Uncharacterized protein n=1 Tax=Streptomyces lomondensis TaxID=68229 RepID=A0ABQ2XQG3_9ACTN|nr:hypothetical protein GCM10010383_69840 [Streptomyces lomondensis]
MAITHRRTIASPSPPASLPNRKCLHTLTPQHKPLTVDPLSLSEAAHSDNGSL